MLIPKASHLVERVAERLLRSGALDESSAQLLRQPGGEARPGMPRITTRRRGGRRDAVDPADAAILAVRRSRRRRRDRVRAREPRRSARRQCFACSGRGDHRPGDGAMPAGGRSSVRRCRRSAGRPPAIHGQPGQAAAGDSTVRADFGASAPPSGPRGGLADPAAGCCRVRRRSMPCRWNARAWSIGRAPAPASRRNSGWCSGRSFAPPSVQARNLASPTCCWSPAPGRGRAKASCPPTWRAASRARATTMCCWSMPTPSVIRSATAWGWHKRAGCSTWRPTRSSTRRR